MLMPAGHALLQAMQLVSSLLAGDLSVVEQWLETLLLSSVGGENQALAGRVEAGNSGIGAGNREETKHHAVPLAGLPDVGHMDVEGRELGIHVRKQLQKGFLE